MFTLLLRLAGPIQSWGSSSLFDERGTDYYPTKSGVIGLVASALGRRRDESLDDLNNLQFGIRIDQQGELLTDYHITNMGPKLNANISKRKYLCDSIFLVGLSSENKDFLTQIANAILCPKYPLYLGRRSCPVTLPVYLSIKEKDLYTALYEEEWLVSDWRKERVLKNNKLQYLRIIIEDPDSTILKRDEPRSFSPFKREYGYRRIGEKNARIIQINSEILETEHDAFKDLE